MSALGETAAVATKTKHTGAETGQRRRSSSVSGMNRFSSKPTRAWRAVLRRPDRRSKHVLPHKLASHWTQQSGPRSPSSRPPSSLQPAGQPLCSPPGRPSAARQAAPLQSRPPLQPPSMRAQQILGAPERWEQYRDGHKTPSLPMATAKGSQVNSRAANGVDYPTETRSLGSPCTC